MSITKITNNNATKLSLSTINKTVTFASMERQISFGSHSDGNDGRLLRSLLAEDSSTSSVRSIRPCYYILQFLGMWKPENSRRKFTWRIYRVFVHLLIVLGAVAIMCLNFVHYGFKRRKTLPIIADLINSASNCIILLSPFIFTQYYFKYGQFNDVVWSVETVSAELRSKLRKKARVYTIFSVTYWIAVDLFFTFHWTPFFSETWQYIGYITLLFYTTGWWAVWLSIYAFVCDAHCLQIDAFTENIRCKETSAVQLLYKQQRLADSLDRTQRDFNYIISFAVSYHALDVIIYSFAYFDRAFGENYEIWQYVFAIVFDLITVLIKLFPPAAVAAAVHRSVREAAKRCDVSLTTEDMPDNNLKLYLYMANRERDMGLKILGISITVELVGKIFMTIVTAGVSFVAFIIPRLIH